MKQVRVVMLSLLMVSLCSLSSLAQQNSAAASNATVPPLIPFASIASDAGGNSMSGVVNITFSLYAAQQGGEPLWSETQKSVPLDSTGHYSVQLGITQPGGVPTTLFTTGEAHWLEVRIAEQADQPRVLLLSVPYALKAADAATIGGLPPSAFMLAPASAAAYARDAVASQSTSPPTALDVTTPGGTANYLPMWDSASDIVNSVLFQTGSGTTGKIGIGITTPAATLDVRGSTYLRGRLTLPAGAAATASKGSNSQPLTIVASAFNTSGTPASVNQNFEWQAEPVNNDTTTASGKLNLLFGQGSGAFAETGLSIASNGQITFAPGQTFPGGGGSGTVTSVATGLGLKGGPITTSGTLSIDTTKIPQLGAANTFTGNQTLNGTLTASSSGSTIVASTGNASDPAIQGSGTSYGIEGNASTTNGTGIFGSGADGVVGQSSYANGNGVFGGNTSTTGTAPGVTGQTSSAAGFGVWGTNISTTGNAVGVYGSSSSATGYGVEGSVSAPNGAAVYAVNNATTGNAFAVFGSSASPSGWGVEGMAPVGVFGLDSSGSGQGVLGQSNSGTGVQGQASTGTAVSGLSGTGVGVYGQTAAAAAYAVVGENLASTGSAPGVYGTTASSTGTGVYGAGPTGVYGSDTSAGGDGDGVYGTSPLGAGVYGISAAGYGVFGDSPDSYGVVGDGGTAGVLGQGHYWGVMGQGAGTSTTGTNAWPAGVWGDTGGASGEYFGVVATADSNISLLAANSDNSGDYPAMVVENYTTATHNPVFQTSSPNTYSNTRHCTIDTSANLSCTGVVSGIAEQVGGRQTATYAMQSAENWLEDAGSGQLSNGSARIELDPAFAQTVNAAVEYHVFLTPKGDSEGLYVSNETPQGFEVREQHGGHSSIAFDYRIMAKRKGYENVRLEDVTERFKQSVAMRQIARAPLPLAKAKPVPAIATLPMHPLVEPRPVPVALTPRPLPPPVRAAQPSKPEANQK